MLGLYVAFMVVNLRGVALGAFANTVLTAAKLVPIAVFIAIGLAHVDGARFTPFAPHGYGELGGTTVLVLYAYVGFEGMAIPAAEMKDPKRSIPLALVTSIGAIAGIYLAMWAVCTGTLPTLAGSKNPVGDAASTFLGPAAATFVQVGIVVSVLGIHAFMALVTPRALYALGHLGLAPAFLGRVSRTRAVPALAIVVTAVAVAALALSGTFAKLAVVSVLARIVQYVLTCLAVLRLRRRADAPAASLRVPFGPVLPIAAVLVCGWLVMATPVDQIVWGTIAIAAGLPLFWLARWGRR
jgi:amino acid transporter